MTFGQLPILFRAFHNLTFRLADNPSHMPEKARVMPGEANADVCAYV